jgi:hypothetical protein
MTPNDHYEYTIMCTWEQKGNIYLSVWCTSIGCVELDESSVTHNMMASGPVFVDLCGSSTDSIAFLLVICKSHHVKKGGELEK